MPRFILRRAEVAERRVPPLSVVEHFDVLEDVNARFSPRRVPPALDQLGLERPEEALDRRVIVAVAAPRHADLRARLSEPRLVLGARVLTPPVAMVEQSRTRQPPTAGQRQRLDDEGRGERRPAGVSDDTPREEVEDDRQVQPAFSRRHIGDVGRPTKVRFFGAEVAPEQVRGDRPVMARVGRAHSPPGAARVETRRLHQAGDALSGAARAQRAQLGVHARRPIRAAATGVGLPDLRQQLAVARGTPRRLALQPGVVAALRD